MAIMALHQQVYAAFGPGRRPGSRGCLRQPDEVADFTDRGRRKMPALMCGADNNYLALTWRQIDTIEKAATDPPFRAPTPNAAAVSQRSDAHATCRRRFIMRRRAIRSVRARSPQSPTAVRGSRSISARSGGGCSRESSCASTTISSSASIPTMRRRSSRASRQQRLKLSELRDIACCASCCRTATRILMMTPIKGPASSDPDGEFS